MCVHTLVFKTKTIISSFNNKLTCISIGSCLFKCFTCVNVC